MAPIFEQVSRELEPKFRFLKVDTEAHPQIAARYGVRGIPNLVVIHKGKVLAQQAGVVDAGRLRAWLAQAAPVA
jgi:thioredoxin 2